MSPPVSNGADATTDTLAPIIDALLTFLWQQWSQLGVSGDAPVSRDNWLIDPETLLLFTLQLGRFDPRLFDEVMDWCATNGEWLSIQRIKALSKPPVAVETEENVSALQGEHPSTDVLAQTLHAVAATLFARNRSGRWRALLPPKGMNTDHGKAKEPIAFFRERTGEPLPIFGKEDPHFRAADLSRSPVNLRGLSMPPPIDAPPCLILKLRALFGLDPRAEVVAYLLTHPIAGTRELARATAYAPSTIHTVLSRLSAGHFLLGGPNSGYEAERARWRAFLGELPLPDVAWVDWARVLPALATALDALNPVTAYQESPYLRASRLLRLGEHLCESLTGSGLPNPFATTWQINDAAERLSDSLLTFARLLNGEKSASLHVNK
jgi:hypothetical protein